MTDQQCQEFLDSLAEECDMEEIGRALKTRFPTGIDRDRLWDYLHRDCTKQTSDPHTSNVSISPEDFVSRIQNANFYNDTETQLLDMISNTCTAIPMGIDAENSTGYRLIPDAYGLSPTLQEDCSDDGNRDRDFCNEDRDFCNENRDFLRSNYLGVNTNVQPRNLPKHAKANKETVEPEDAAPGEGSPFCHQQSFPKKSTKSTISGITGPGFHFHQIGILQAFSGRFPVINKKKVDAKAKKVGGEGTEKGKFIKEKAWENVKKKRADGTWYDTDFYVVGELNEKGHISNFWIIFNTFLTNDEDGDRFEYKGDEWGILPNSHQQFSCAKMQPKAAFGSTDTKITWVDQIDHPVELVMCVRGPQGEVLRATVEEEMK